MVEYSQATDETGRFLTEEVRPSSTAEPWPGEREGGREGERVEREGVREGERKEGREEGRERGRERVDREGVREEGREGMKHIRGYIRVHVYKTRLVSQGV